MAAIVPTRFVIGALLVTLLPGAAHAIEPRSNAIGAYMAPTTHHVASGTDTEQMESSTMLDLGLYYRRVLTRTWDIQADVRFASREFMAEYMTILFPGATLIRPTREEFLEIPVIMHACRTVSVGDAVVRIAVGGGAYYAVLITQEFPGWGSGSTSLPDPIAPLDGGGYSRYGLLGDGGVTLVFQSSNAVSLGFRFQDDLGISGEPERSIAREDMAFGFYAGFEWLF
jgi:hypothetical protein